MNFLIGKMNSTEITRCLGTDQEEYAKWDMEYLSDLKNLSKYSRVTYDGRCK